MKRILALSLCVLFSATSVLAQKYLTRTGQVVFDASTPLENIHGINNEAASIIDLSTGTVVFQVLVKSFKLEKELMQEHFNEDYMESNQYPRADFIGKVTHPDQLNPAKDGTYQVQVKGRLSMHGVTRDITVPATLILKGDVLEAHAKLIVKTADYHITIPALVRNKIAKKAVIIVNAHLKKR